MQKTRAFSKGRAVLAGISTSKLRQHALDGTLMQLPGIGKSIASVAAAALLDQPNTYLDDLELSTALTVEGGGDLRRRYKGDCHTHSTWSDGGASILDMANTAQELGHSYLVLTDHSARLTIAHGLSEERLLQQLDEIAVINHQFEQLDTSPSTKSSALNEDSATEEGSFRILTGMEVDILEDGSLDLSDEALSHLDVVVASAHSKLAQDSNTMTSRLLRAVSNPHVDILGHCTNRKIMPDQRIRTRRGKTGGTREPSTFDADAVFAACAKFSTAVEINCRPERQDPPPELLDLAKHWDCDIAINSDAHAPGQLEWVSYGCDKANQHGIDPKRILNLLSAQDLLNRLEANSSHGPS